MACADPTLGPWPDPSDGVCQSGAWILRDERPLPRELDACLESSEPPIYFGFDSTPVAHGAGPQMRQAARALGRRAVVSRGWFDVSLVDDAGDCLSIGEINVQALFPHVVAVVHHGGAGTTTAAALAAAPQVVVRASTTSTNGRSRSSDLPSEPHIRQEHPAPSR